MNNSLSTIGLQNGHIEKRKWSQDEVKKLMKVVKSCGTCWLKVAKHMPDRSPNQCAQKWKGLKGTRSRTNNFWTKEEDDQLSALVVRFGQKWAMISKNLKGRSSKQCRDRYLNILDPYLNSEPFTHEEDQLIYQNYLVYGARWATIAKALNQTLGHHSLCRSENKVKNRFYTFIRAKFLQVNNPYYSSNSIEEAFNQQPQQSHSSLTEEESWLCQDDSKFNEYHQSNDFSNYSQIWSPANFIKCRDIEDIN